MIVALGLTPVLGLTFLMFLPLAGFVLFFLHLVELERARFLVALHEYPSMRAG